MTVLLADVPTVPVPVFRSSSTSTVVHDEHAGVRQAEWFPSLAAALGRGLRACLVCKPAAP